jgi:hypothetical protein
MTDPLKVKTRDEHVLSDYINYTLITLRGLLLWISQNQLLHMK